MISPPPMNFETPESIARSLQVQAEDAPTSGEMAITVLDFLNSYVHIFLVAFLVTLLLTPLVRKAAISAGVVDRPGARKQHTQPIAYLGGIAVFFGLLMAIGVSYVMLDETARSYAPVPIAIVIGMAAIAITGFLDDVWGWDPRLKIAGQLVAAAALAIEEVGVRVAAGVLVPLFGQENLMMMIPVPGTGGAVIEFDIVYWVGTGIIAVFVLGGCNAANLIDGLDGLLSGVIAIVAVGLLLISLLMAPALTGAMGESLAGARIVLCLALLGAVLGFLPHNFNPANIFLGDSGSLLLGYMSVVIILMFGEHGQTHLVCAGLIVFALPIMDTMLSIIRRKLAGVPMSAADDQHLHHQLKRSFGGVKRAVIALYGISAIFAALGISLAALLVMTELRVRFVYVIAIVLFSFIGAIAVKAAQREQHRLAARPQPQPSSLPAPSPKPNAEEPDVAIKNA